MRVVGEFKRVRHDDEIDGVLGKRQPMRIGDDVGRRIVIERPPQRNPALRQKRALGQPDLQRMKAENIGDRLIEIGLLPREQVLPEVGGEPLGQRR